MKYTLEQLESMMVKARLLGKEITSYKTKCEHTIYLFKDVLDRVNLLYIPDDVECIEQVGQCYGVPGYCPRYCDIECKTLIIMGGRSLTDVNYMFKECKAQSIDLSNLDTSNVTNMEGMFFKCYAQSLDLSNFNTSKVKDMYWMFSECQSQSIDLSNFDTSSVTNMSLMFEKCHAQYINLSNFDTLQVTNMSEMFKDCRAEVKATDTKILKELRR